MFVICECAVLMWLADTYRSKDLQSCMSMRYEYFEGLREACQYVMLGI